VLVAAIGAGATVEVALIAAVATLGAAAIDGAATVVAAGIDAWSNGDGGGSSDGGGDEGGGDGDGGETGSSAHNPLGFLATTPQGCGAALQGGNIWGQLGDTELLQVGQQWVPGFMQAFIERAFQLAITSHEDRGLRASANYHFDGDVMKSPEGCDFIANSDTIAWSLTLEKNENAASDYFLFSIEDLVLTTTEVPDTLGRSTVSFTAYQHNEEIWHWNALALQGEAPTYDPLPNGAIVVEDTGKLHVSNFWTTIPFEFAPGETLADVTVVMTYAGKGERI